MPIAGKFLEMSFDRSYHVLFPGRMARSVWPPSFEITIGYCRLISGASSEGSISVRYESPEAHTVNVRETPFVVTERT